jgi:type I restriction enzyme S subunit
MSTVKLGEICEINPATDYDFDPEDACSFVPMEAVDDVDARIARMATRPFREVAKGYTPFAENDVIVAKITPCMENGKCAIGRRLRSGVAFGSTEFHVLRATKRVIPEWLFYFWRFPPTRKLAAVNMTGSAGQKRVPASFLETADIPLPEMSEQRRIARRLEQADRLRRTRRYALELTDTFLPAAFLELFGDPTTNPLGLPVVELGDFLSFVTSGSRGWADYYVPEGARFIRSLDVRMNNISDEDAVFVKPPKGAEADRTRVKPADVLLTITGSRIGRVAPVPERLNGAFISQHVAILRLKAGLLPEFLSMFLSLDTGGQREIACVQYGQTKPGLNLDQIRELRVPLPHLCRQQQFLELAKRVERLRSVQSEALRQAEHLFASLLHRAFSG